MRIGRIASILFFWALATFGLPSAAFAVLPDEMLSDPALEARARDISGELRCLVCQNESIDNSNADLARDLRLLVRKRLVSGDTNQQVLDYIVARYGEFVLLKPSFALHNLVLWAAPFALLLGGGILLSASARKRVRAETPALSEQEDQALQRILGEKETKGLGQD
jgi:cytochrome c-type biogenesis protein CcmH